MEILNATKNLVSDFAHEEEGAQIVEYGLIIAAVSLGLIALLYQLVNGSGNTMQTLVTNVGTWLASTAKS